MPTQEARAQCSVNIHRSADDRLGDLVQPLTFSHKTQLPAPEALSL
jgi:hypothetical protein